MAIHRLLQKSAFGPEDIDLLAKAYEDALRALHINGMSDPAPELVAKAIIAIAQTGERDPATITSRTLAALGQPLEE
jgi:hypothetical protein